jgi:hypothetical protein
VNRFDIRSLYAERYPLRVSRETFLCFDEVIFGFWRPLFTVSIGYSTADKLLWYKFKAVPLQAWSGPDGSRKLRFPDFLDNGIGWW